jgi:hypothetical protein
MPINAKTIKKCQSIYYVLCKIIVYLYLRILLSIDKNCMDLMFRSRSHSSLATGAGTLKLLVLYTHRHSFIPYILYRTKQVWTEDQILVENNKTTSERIK